VLVRCNTLVLWSLRMLQTPPVCSLRHIYHYYIHGPEGNTTMSRQRKNVGATDVNIKVLPGG